MFQFKEVAPFTRFFVKSNRGVALKVSLLIFNVYRTITLELVNIRFPKIE